MIDVSALVGDIPTTSVTLRLLDDEPEINTDVYGESANTYVETEVTAVVHPSGRRELERRGLDYSRETISVYLRLSSSEDSDFWGSLWGSTQPELSRTHVVYQGRAYEVVRVADYRELGGIWMMHAQLIDP